MGLEEIPDKSDSNGALYLPEAFIQRGGGDCEDWAFTVGFMLENIEAYDINPKMLYGSYKGTDISHVILYFPSHDIPVDPLYWWKSPREIVETFEPIEHEPLEDLEDALRFYPIKGTDWDVQIMKQKGYLK